MSVALKTRPTSADHDEAAPRLLSYRFTVEQYHRMIETGVFAEKDRVELLEGRIVLKMTHNPPHAAAIDLTKSAIEPLVPPSWRLRIQSPITTVDSEPEPDIAVVRGPARRYVQVHPGFKDIGLLIEVADSSILEDRIEKGRIYARARIPVYWIVNIPERQIEVYTLPRAGKIPAYRQRRDFGVGLSVPVEIDGREIGQVLVDDLLP